MPDSARILQGPVYNRSLSDATIFPGIASNWHAMADVWAGFVLACISTGLVQAQYGPQLPIPHIGHRRKPADDPQRPPLSTEGIVRSNDGKTLVVGSADGRTFTMALTEKTAYLRDGKPLAAKAIVPGAIALAARVFSRREGRRFFHLD